MAVLIRHFDDVVVVCLTFEIEEAHVMFGVKA